MRKRDKSAFSWVAVFMAVACSCAFMALWSGEVFAKLHEIDGVKLQSGEGLRPMRDYVGRYYPARKSVSWEGAQRHASYMSCVTERGEVVCYLYPDQPYMMMERTMDWKTRIVGITEQAPDQLLHNPYNWRIHTEQQRKGITGALSGVGWVTGIIVNQRTGHIVDGHARAEEAMRAGQKSVPVLLVDLSENEERLVLASLDPLCSLAVTDDDELRKLLEEVSTDNADLLQLLEEVAVANGIVPGEEDEEGPGKEPGSDERHPVVAVLCDSDKGRQYVAAELIKQGYDVRLGNVKESELESA